MARVQVPKTAELVAAQLRRQIVRGELSAGDALPSETALVASFGVSRPTLREAFRVLESESLITVRRGARGGARVEAPNRDVAARYASFVLEHRGVTMADVYQARTIIETPCAGLLARRRTASDLEQLWASVREAEAALGEPDRFIRLHTEFHALLVRLAANPVMAVINEMVRDIIDLANWTKFARDASPSTARVSHKGAKAHRRLVELIEVGDAESAEVLWRKHLIEAGEYLLEGPGAQTVVELLD
jgi:DNA-binding FadR family transcriptional regulator